jgi:hypothetical protein
VPAAEHSIWGSWFFNPRGVVVDSQRKFSLGLKTTIGFFARIQPRCAGADANERSSYGGKNQRRRRLLRNSCWAAFRKEPVCGRVSRPCRQSNCRPTHLRRACLGQRGSRYGSRMGGRSPFSGAGDTGAILQYQLGLAAAARHEQ